MCFHGDKKFGMKILGVYFEYFMKRRMKKATFARAGCGNNNGNCTSGRGRKKEGQSGQRPCITMAAKCLWLPVAVFTLLYAKCICICSCISSNVSALESPGQLMCCLHAVHTMLQLLSAFVCSEAFKKFTIQFFFSCSHTRIVSLSHPFLAVCRHLACISNCILY